MKDFLILCLIIGMLFFLYVYKDDKGTTIEKLQHMSGRVVSFGERMTKQSERELLLYDIQVKVEETLFRWGVIELPGNAIAPIGDQVYVAITLLTGTIVEGRLESKTKSGDYVIAVPGSILTVVKEEIAQVHQLDDMRAAVVHEQIYRADFTKRMRSKKQTQSHVATLTKAIQWQTNYAQALSVAKEKNCILMIFFSRSDSADSAQLETITFQFRRAIYHLNRDFVCLRLDTKTSVVLTNQYGVQTFPTLVFALANGAELDRHEGYIDPDDFIRFLDDMKEKRPLSLEEVLA